MHVFTKLLRATTRARERASRAEPAERSSILLGSSPMSSQAATAAAATLVSLAFALSTLDRALRRRRHHEVAWTISLLLFSVGAAALWAGAAFGWGEWGFKTFYLSPPASTRRSQPEGR